MTEIDRLRAKLAITQRELVAAVEDLKDVIATYAYSDCNYCKYKGMETEEHIGNGGCHACQNHGGFYDLFEWRGSGEREKALKETARSMSIREENKLKPCPFCGRMPEKPRRLSDISTYRQVGMALELVDRHEVWIVECAMHAAIYGRSPEKAAEAWNRRINERQDI